MQARARRLIGLTALLTTTVMITLTGAPNANAADLPPNPTAEADGQLITVTVSGSGYTQQEGGSSGSGHGPQVYVPAPCWMYPTYTGKEFYDFVKSGEWASTHRTHDDPVEPWAGYEKYKDDDQGYWYAGQCSSANWPDQDDLSGWFTFSDQYFPTHRPVYVPAGEPRPAPEVPAELLREVAIKSMTLPDPELDWNPKIRGNDATLVNMDTWFWLNNAPPSLDVRAEALGRWATVTATFGGMDITAPGEDTLPCTGAGTRYVPGAQATTCALPFSRASVGLGTQATGQSGAESTPVTVRTRWAATWEANGRNMGAITLRTDPEATVDIRVDEVQTLVTGTG